MTSSQLQLFGLKENGGVSLPKKNVSPLPLAFTRQHSSIQTINPARTLEKTLQTIFPTTQEDTKLQKARRIMGDLVESLTDEELQVYLTEFQCLIDGWLDDFEKQAFQGSTLIETLKER